MRIGVVTPAFNVAPYISDAIRSVLAQTHQSWSMTIVDDGSSDATAAIAAGFAEPRIRLIRQRNAGVSAARDRGLAALPANVDAVLFLDADDWLAPRALAALAKGLSAAPDAVAVVGPYQRLADGTTRRSRVCPPPAGDLLKPLLVRNLFANGGHVLIRRRALEVIGPFFAGLDYGEDWEFWTRLACLGRFAAAPARTPLLFVRERPDSAYRGLATRPESFRPCMDAIFGAAELRSRFAPNELARLRRRAEAENDWVVGRELLRHGRAVEGRRYLWRSITAAPGLKRLALLATALLPALGVGPFRPYSDRGSA